MMPWCHGWGSRPPLIAPNIHIGHIYSALVTFNELHRHISAPLHYDIDKAGQILAILGDCRVEMMPWCHGWGLRPPLIAFHIHIGHIHSVLAPFNHEVYRHISAPLHCYTAEAWSDFGNSGWLLSVVMMPLCHGWGCRSPFVAFNIHIGHIYNVLAPFNEVPRHKSTPLHRYTAEAGSMRYVGI